MLYNVVFPVYLLELHLATYALHKPAFKFRSGGGDEIKILTTEICIPINTAHNEMNGSQPACVTYCQGVLE